MGRGRLRTRYIRTLFVGGGSSRCEEEGSLTILLEHMMGQRDVRLRHGANYDVFDPEYIRREYSKAESLLTVCENPVVYGIESHWEPGEPPPKQSYPGQQYPSGLDGQAIGHFRTMSEPA